MADTGDSAHSVDTLTTGKLICCPVNHTGTNLQPQPNSSAVAIIPARFASTRLPGKVLLEISGKPMIVWVVERALAAKNISQVVVATDDERVRDAVMSAGYEVVMTRPDHASGTDRLAEAASAFPEANVIVNVQGDEPMISPETIERAINELQNSKSTGIVTTWEPMEAAADVLNPDVVKIVVNDAGRAIYFSRAAVPHLRDVVRQHGSLANALEKRPELLKQFKKHTGLYVYRRSVLLEFTNWPPTQLERLEGLEQLRALANGVEIRAIEAATKSIGVDTAEDLERVRREMAVRV